MQDAKNITQILAKTLNEPNAIKSRCKIHKFVNLQREFQNLQREFSLPAKMQEKHKNLQRDFKVFFYGFRMDFFNQNAETSVAAEPNAHLPLQIP